MMKLPSLLRLLLLFASPLPLFAEAQRLSLDGTWAFTIDPQQRTRPAAEWDQVPVPGNWDTHNAYAEHVGKGYYQRDFTVPAEWRGRHVRLRFEAVYETAEVLLNGAPLGRHEGGYTPFEFEVTSQLRWDQPNTVTVIADNKYRRGAWWAWGGISRSVHLIATEDVRIVHQHIRTEFDPTTRAATVFVQYLLGNDGSTPIEVAVAARATSAGAQESVGETGAKITVPARGTARATASFPLAAGQVRPWHFDHPHLYELVSTAAVAGRVQHTRRDRFGVRRVDVKPDGLYLNGERVRLVGFNRVHDHRTYGNTEPEHLVRQDVDRMKRYGGNFMRIMHAPAAPNLLDYLDEKGVLVFTEIPVWGQGDPNVVTDNPRTRQWLREMVERDYNHPSIIGWSVGNELLNHFDYVKSMIDYTRRELDPHRLISYVSYSGARAEYTPANDPISVSDLILHNTYTANPGQLVDTISAKWPNRPIFLSEFGARQFGETLDSRIPGLDERWSSLAGRPHVIGAALWTYNDYRSDYRGSAPGQLRSWGIVDLWRREKAAARDIARLHSPVRLLRVQQGQARLETRSAEEFPSFTLRGYRLAWEWRAPDGTTHGGGMVALPDLAPGASLDVPLAGKATSPTARTLVATLVSPLGYVVHDTAQASEPPPAPVVTLKSPPVIHHAEPFDGGFMLGYSNQPDDASFEVEYGTTPGEYPHRMQVAMKGALAVRGLENGRTYHARLRRHQPEIGPSAWSEPVSVTPDGGQRPSAPQVLGAVRGEPGIALRLRPVPKAIAYRVRWAAGSAAGEKLFQLAEPGFLFVDAPAAGSGPLRVSAISAGGESEPTEIAVPAR